jgi:hypothetical protein
MSERAKIESPIIKFAEQFRLRTQWDSLGEMFIPCQRGHLCEIRRARILQKVLDKEVLSGRQIV